MAWHLQRLRPAAERGVVRDGQIEPEQVDDGTDQPLGLPQRQMEYGPERQRRQDRHGRIPALPALGCARLGRPGCDRLVRKPHRQAASLAQRGIIREPRRVCRRLVFLSHAAIGSVSSSA